MCAGCYFQYVFVLTENNHRISRARQVHTLPLFSCSIIAASMSLNAAHTVIRITAAFSFTLAHHDEVLLAVYSAAVVQIMLIVQSMYPILPKETRETFNHH